MKTLLSLLLATAITLPTLGKTFEGVIHATMTAGNSVMRHESAVKGEMMRVDMQLEQNQTSTAIFNGKTGEMFFLMPQMKTYMVFGGMKEVVAGSASQATLEETGRTETIAGYKCAEYVVRDGKTVVEFWATTGLGRFVAFAEVQKNRGKSPPWADALAEKGLYPLRTVTKDRRGKVQTVIEATRVEKKSVSDDLFKIPEDYQKFGMPNLGGLLKGLGG